MAQTPTGLAAIKPGVILTVLLLEFALLVALMLVYIYGLLPAKMFPALIGGIVPIAVPWGGALGGVSNALVGISSHWREYFEENSKQGIRWHAWYLVQLPLGAALGTVAALIVVLIVGTVGTTTTGAPDLTTTGQATLFLLSFIVGYQQDVFRRLIARTIEVVLGPGTKTTDGPAFSTSGSLAFGDVPVNDVKKMPLAIANQGDRLLKVPAGAVTIDNDAFTVASSPRNIASGESGEIVVAFAPTEKKAYEATLTITVGDTVRTVVLTGTGT